MMLNFVHLLVIFTTLNAVYSTKFINKIRNSPLILKPDRLLLVLHNVRPENAKNLAYQLSSIGLQSCTISLRHTTAIQALDIFIQNSNDMIVGASTVVSATQIKDVKQCGAKFVSTMFPSYELIKTSCNNDISILCGVVTYRDTKNALEWGAHGLKFYPANQVSPENFMNIKKQINEEGMNMYDTSCYIAGGITNHQYDSYLRAGIDGFAIGIDCDTFNPLTVSEQILSKYASIYNNEYNNVIV